MKTRNIVIVGNVGESRKDIFIIPKEFYFIRKGCEFIVEFML